jgi:tRNA-dihydrouridine synthase C
MQEAWACSAGKDVEQLLANVFAVAWRGSVNSLTFFLPPFPPHACIAMTILLAPMEGLLDFTLRDILTRVGGIDRCVSEFIRVTGTLLPDRVFRRIVPEVDNAGCTPAGVPVRAQLLGSDPVCLAENAAKLAALGPAGIDLNFGCPAKAVNRHRGGAVLLDEPELIAEIVSAVRRAVPAAMPVSAKMRLGYHDAHRALECAHAIAGSGAGELVVHARTKLDGYRPPAYWERISEIRAAVSIPVVANGEIWSVDDAVRCREVSGCHALMLGRGMVSDPGLALAIASPGQLGAQGLPWQDLLPLIQAFWQLIGAHIEPRHRAGRLKQWLNYLRRRHPQAQAVYADVRTVNDPAEVSRMLFDRNAGMAAPACPVS